MISRARANALVEADLFQRAVLTVISVNAVTLGMETSRTLVDQFGPLLRAIELMVVVAFIVEILLRLYARGLAFFRDPWNWFDLIVVAVAVVPATNFITVVRVLRVLRLARLVSVVPSLRRVVSALFNAVPGITSIIAMLAAALYTGAILGTQLFRDVAPEYFSSLDRSLFTMFEIMTVENWPGIAEPIVRERPAAWVFFVAYIVLVAFILLNLLIGVIVSAMEIEVNRDRWQADQELELRQHETVMIELRTVRDELRGSRHEVRELRQLVSELQTRESG